jgi:hypothetical protein
MDINIIYNILSNITKEVIDEEINKLKEDYNFTWKDPMVHTKCGITSLIVMKLIKKYYNFNDNNITKSTISSTENLLDFIKNSKNFCILYIFNSIDHCFLLIKDSKEVLIIQSYYYEYALYDKNKYALQIMSIKSAEKYIKLCDYLNKKNFICNDYVKTWFKLTGVKLTPNNFILPQKPMIYLYKYSDKIISKL